MNDIHFIVTGGGGAPLYEFPEKFIIEPVKAKVTEHLIKVSIDKNKLSLQTIDINDKIIDEFEITK